VASARVGAPACAERTGAICASHALHIAAR
jgi:hypothetical protein